MKFRTLRTAPAGAFTRALLVGLGSLGIYLAALLIPLPKPVGLLFRSGFTTVIPLFGAVLYLAFRLDGWKGRFAVLALSLAAFAFPLSALWSSGQSEPYVLGGLLPFSDAGYYYQDALRLLNGFLTSDFSARRPLSTGLLTFLLWSSGRNLQVALAVLTALAGVCCVLFARQARLKHGALVGAFCLVFLFCFYRGQSGKTMSETLGLGLGALAAVLFLHGAATRKTTPALLGLFFLTLALNARAGAFFVLPAILVWGSLALTSGRRPALRFFGLGLAVIAAGFLINGALMRWIASEGAVFSNFSYTLYGLVSGGTGWGQIGIDHPEVMLLPVAEQQKQIYHLATQIFRTHPELTFLGALRSWGMFLSTDYYSVFCFIGENHTLTGTASRLGLYALSLVGLAGCARSARRPENSLVLAAAAGILISVPFAPPLDSSRMRAYAATLPLMTLIPAVGLSTLLHLPGVEKRIPWILSRFSRAGQSSAVSQPGRPETAWISAGLGIVLIGLAVIAPVVLQRLTQPLPPPSTALTICPDGQSPARFRLDPGAYLRLLPPDAGGPDRVPDLRINFFKKYLHNSPHVEIFSELDPIQAPGWMAVTIDLDSGDPLMVIGQSSELPAPGTLIQACGTYPKAENGLVNWFFFIKSYTLPGSFD